MIFNTMGTYNYSVPEGYMVLHDGNVELSVIRGLHRVIGLINIVTRWERIIHLHLH